MTASENAYAPGFPCPECHEPIVVPIRQLAIAAYVTCAHCGLVLTIERDQSPVLAHVETLWDRLNRTREAP